jgi:tight adherence protein C
MDPVLIIGVLIVGVGAVALVTALGPTAPATADDAAAYLRSLDSDLDEADEFQQLLAEPFLTRVLRPLAAHVQGMLTVGLPSNYRDSIRRKLQLAGLSGRYRPEEIILGQVLAAGVAFAAVLLWATFGSDNARMSLLLLVGAPMFAGMVPQAMLNRKVEERQSAIRRDLPDTLDLLAISVEAGMGFEGALAVVCEHFDSPLAEEFSRTLKEMELGLPRREALQNLKRRTEVPELSNFVIALTQADALGMPVGRVLQTQAAEMRTKRRQWAREKAAKLPIKILFPLVGLIFPPIFIVVLGPAASQIAQAFS